MTPEPKTTYTYRSGTSEGLGVGWDVLQVIQRREDSGVRIANSVLIARDASGTIMRGTDLNRWEIIKAPDDLRVFQNFFDERDRLAAEQTENS
jgi:hypothetical protein